MSRRTGGRKCTQGENRPDAFRSVAQAASVEIVRKRSRFIGLVSPVVSAGAAEERLAEARETYPGAAHYCYAYRTGPGAPVVRMSDDGEPQGTAGRPILEVLERNGVENTCAVIVRYFGGTLLGAGGLTRAYAAATSAALDRAGTALYTKHAILVACFTYADWSRVERTLEVFGARTLDTRYQDVVEADLAVALTDAERLREELMNVTAGEGEVRHVGERYFPQHSQ